jgi:iron complex outermembrane receptor protein
MFKKTKICAGMALAFGSGLFVAATPVIAQDQRIEITGSAIKRVDAEGALPVQIIRQEDIKRSGVTSVTELIQRLPAMAGATTEAASVGGGGGGFSGASIHNIGETRTLVLLNGRRLTQFGGQTLTGFGAAIDLNTLPLSSIDRVEVLTDGASALYGSDAIAGVVNFITRRDETVGDVTLGGSWTDDGGADEQRFSISKGFGNLDTDGFNIFGTFSYDKRKPLNAPQREASKSGVINFGHNGKKYQAFLGSPSTIPGNAIDDQGATVNPYHMVNGSCAPGSVAAEPDPDNHPGKIACYYDFVAALEVYPERERRNFMVGGDVKLGKDHTLFGDILISKTESTGIIAPVPGGVGIPVGSALWNQYLAPLNGVNGSSFVVGANKDANGNLLGSTTSGYRLSDMGRRADGNESEFESYVVGVRGLIGNWDYETGLAYSKNDFTNTISGYPGALALQNLRASGKLNPFVQVGEMSQDSLDAIAATNFSGYWDGGTSELTSFDFRTSTSLMQLAGGSLGFATGFNIFQEKFQSKPSLFAQGKLADPVAGTLCDADGDGTNELPCDQRFGDAAAFIPYGADRKVWGIFAEVNAPITKELELTGALRYDDYNDVGSTTNGKVTASWRPAGQNLLVRGSIGTGFKAPTVPMLNAAAQSYGVTSSPYDCTPELLSIATSLGAVCQPNGRQYDVVAGGNQSLKPEESRQATLGIVFDVAQGYSIGADYWWVGIENAFGQIQEGAAFNDPTAYPGSWTTQTDIGTNTTYLAYNQTNLNLGKEYYSGIDFNLQGRTPTEWGRLDTRLAATYMLRDERQLVPGGTYYKPIGVNEANLQVATFRWQGRFDAALTTGDWTNAFAVNFKSGYKDAVATVEVLGDGNTNTGVYEDVQLKISSYITVDWQTRWQVAKNFSVTGGILNLFDEAPPLSLAEGGNGKGQMYGYDDRYADIRGRTFYINGSFAF